MPISGGTVPESPLHACTSGQLVLVGQGLFTALHSQLFIHSSRTTPRDEGREVEERGYFMPRGKRT